MSRRTFECKQPFYQRGRGIPSLSGQSRHETLFSAAHTAAQSILTVVAARYRSPKGDTDVTFFPLIHPRRRPAPQLDILTVKLHIDDRSIAILCQSQVHGSAIQHIKHRDLPPLSCASRHQKVVRQIDGCFDAPIHICGRAIRGTSNVSQQTHNFVSFLNAKALPNVPK